MGVIAALGSAIVAVAVLYVHKRLVQMQKVRTVVRNIFLVAWASALLFVLIIPGSVPFNAQIIGLGFLNAIGAFLLLSAINQTLAKTAVIVPQKQIVAMGLSAVILGEWRLFDPHTSTGVLLVVGVAVTICATALLTNSSEKAGGKMGARWLFVVLGVIGLVGTVEFLMKYFAINGVGSQSFLISWYTGSVVGAIVFDGILKKSWRPFEGLHDCFLLYVFAGMGMIVSLGLSFFSLGRIPAAVFFPLFTFTTTIGGAMVGFLFFNEHHTWRTRDWIGFGMGILGVVLLIISTSWQ